MKAIYNNYISSTPTIIFEVEDISEINDIHIEYDGGRFYININGKEVFQNLGAGNDFSLNIKKD